MVARRGSLSGYKRPRRGEAGAASRDKENRRERVNMPLSEVCPKAVDRRE